MRKKIFFVSILFLIFNSIDAQDVEKGFKLLKKKSYGRAEKIFLKMIEKNPDEPVAYLGLGQVYSVLKYENKDLFYAYELVKQAESKFKELNDVGKNRNNRFISEIIINDVLNDVDDKLYESIIKDKKRRELEKFIEIAKDSKYYDEILDFRASKDYLSVKNKNTLEHYEKFIKKYPNFSKIKEATNKRNDLAFKKAKDIHTEKSYNIFIKKYPEAPQIYVAEKFRNEKVFKEAKFYNTIESYSKFINKYPDANEIIEATILRDKLAFAETKQINSIRSFDDFIKKYPEAKQVLLAIKLRNELAFKKAKRLHTIKSYTYFIDTYPDAEQIEEAEKLKENLAYDPAKASNSAESFNDYMKVNPQGKKYRSAFNFKANLLAKKLKNTEITLSQSVWMKVFDKDKTEDIAKSISTNKDNEILISCTVKDNEIQNTWLIKLDKYANLIWDKFFEESQNNIIHSTAFTKTNEIVIVGEKSGNLWFIKLDSKANVVWEKIMEQETGIDVKVNKYDKIFLTSTTGNNIKVYKLESTGEIIWTKEFENYGKAKSIQLFGLNIFILGENGIIKLNEKGETILDKRLEDLAFNHFLVKKNIIFIVGEKENDFLVLKLDGKFKKKWLKTYDKSKQNDVAHNIKMIKANEIIVSGLSNANTENQDVWILKLNYQGGKMDEKVFQTSSNETIPKFILSDKNEIILFTSSQDKKNGVLIKFSKK